MRPLSDLPVQRRLGLAMLMTSTFALVVACAVFLALEYFDFRRSLQQTVATLARVTAENSTAPIAFADERAARETLESLRAEPQIVLAALYDAQGRLFASYVADAAERLPAVAPAGVGAGVREEGGHVVAVEPVVEAGRALGTLYVRATQEAMLRRMRTTAGVALAVLALSIVAASLMAHLLGRTLAEPILELDRTASAVTARQDYSLRAQHYGGDDELGRLTTAFNAMLATTQDSLAALRESEQRFRVLADHAPVHIWLTDVAGQCVWLNQRWLEFTGRELAPSLGRGWADDLHPEDRRSTVHAFDDAFSRRRAFRIEYRLRRRDGEYRWILCEGLPRHDAGGAFLGFIGSGIDVSDRKLAEQEVVAARDRALAASRAKDNFLAALSHELRTPLTPVLLLATEEASNRQLPESVRADFELIAKNVSLEARLIDDLLDLTRITRGKLVLERVPVDAHAIVRDALGTVRADFAEKRVELAVQLGAPRHRVQGDAVRLQQVFWNILKNAVKFTPTGGRVTVETSVIDRDRWLVRVSDTGIGLTGDEIERIFEAFAQGDHAETQAVHQFGGLGLGLAISQRLAQLHGGDIRARSAGRDQGATFEVELPLLPEDGAAPEPKG